MSPAASENEIQQAWRELSQQHWDAARCLSERHLVASPGCAAAFHILGLALWGLSDLSAAIQALEQAALLDPANGSLWSDLGVLLYSDKNWPEAVHAFAQALAVEPQNFTALRGSADSLLQMNRATAARQGFERCLALRPDSPSILRSIAMCLALEGCPNDALPILQRSLDIQPDSDQSLDLLATILHKLRRFEHALEISEAGARRYPLSFAAQTRLAVAYWEVGAIHQALATRRLALELTPDDRNLEAHLSWLALHDPDQTPQGLLAAHRQAAANWAKGGPANSKYENNRARDRRLRIGYLSGEFVSNPVSCFFLPWMPLHDKSQVETYYYMSRRAADVHTGMYRSFADHWSDVWDMTDDALAARVVDDGIDILVDLSGHFADNRLGVFARRPAPVQVTYPNYPSTTGVAGIDYIFTDTWTTPPGSDDEYIERPYRLPSGYLVFQLPLSIEPRVTAPMLARGHVTFGLFQRPSKYNDELWEAVASILLQVRDARLLVHFASAELEEAGSPQRRRILAPLAERGIDTERVAFRGTQLTPDHLATVASVDIALDTFPYNGQTTTCDCLWMGVPVVTRQGSTHVSRVTAGLLRRAGLDSLVTNSFASYVDQAVSLARAPEELGRLRAGMRNAIASGSLNDGARLAREIERAYRVMWTRWCEA